MASATTGIAGKSTVLDAAHSIFSDPPATLSVDGPSSDEQRTLERDLELASEVQRRLLPETDVRFGDWRIHYQY